MFLKNWFGITLGTPINKNKAFFGYILIVIELLINQYSIYNKFHTQTKTYSECKKSVNNFINY